MKKRTRLTAILLILALVVTAVPTGIALLGGTEGITEAQREQAMKEASQLSAASWMSAIPDDSRITSVTIPGTHDSATAHIPFSYFLRCQKLGIEEQLYAGFRYLDIRLAVDESGEGGTSLKLIHSFADCKDGPGPMAKTLHFEDVLSDIYGFLEANSSETVFLMVKDEGEKDDPAEFESAFFSYVDQAPDMWYTKNTIPTMSEARGKIVLGTRFDDVNGEGDERMGLRTQWSDQSETEPLDDVQEVVMLNDNEMLYVQDRYNYSVADKWAAFCNTLDYCMAGDVTLSLNYLSTSGRGSTGHPRGYADTLNSQLLRISLKHDVCYGVVIVDFGEEALARHIFASNVSN